MGLDIAEFMMDVEDKYEIRLSDQRTYWPIRNVGDLIKTLLTVLKEQHPERIVDETLLFTDIKAILFDRFGIKPDTVTYGSRFIEDFGLG